MENSVSNGYKLRTLPRFSEVEGLMKIKMCPCCNFTASGKEDIESAFGFRQMKTGQIIPQSWCRNCRNHGTLDFHEICSYR